MNTLSIDLGINEYQLAPDCIVKFNPSDTAFLTKFYDGMEAYDAVNRQYHEKTDGIKDARAVLNEIAAADKEMRSIIDGVFGVPVCDAIFGDMHLTARSSNGVPVGMELFMTIIDQCDLDMTSIADKGQKYVDKYTKKYMKKYQR